MSVNKLIVSLFIVLTAISLIAVGLFHYISHLSDIQRKNEFRERVNKITSLYQSLGIRNQNPHEPTLVIYFNSECDHCEREVKDFRENLDGISGRKLVFVSSEPTDQAISFLSEYDLSKFYIKTDTEDIIKTFIGGVPQVFSYVDGKLDQHFIGETSVNVIIDSLIDKSSR